MGDEAHLVWVDYVLDAFRGIGFKDADDPDYPGILYELKRGELQMFLHALDKKVDLDMVLEDADSCGVREELVKYLITSLHGSGQREPDC